MRRFLTSDMLKTLQMLHSNKSLSFELIRTKCQRAITKKITEFSAVSDRCTLTNGMEVGWLKRPPYRYTRFLIGNLGIDPIAGNGKYTFRDFVSCLSQEDLVIVNKIAAKVIMSRLSRKTPNFSSGK